MLMAPTRSPAGLSTADLERIRETLSTGRRPKVVFTEQAGQIVGQTGQVVQLTDPAVSDEWLVVRFGRDELPFSPTDLALPSRNGAAKTAKSRDRADPVPPAPKEEQVPPAPTDRPATTGRSAQIDKTAPKAAADKPAAGKTNADQPSKPARGARTGKAGRTRTPAGLTVTLAYESGEWTVAAHAGNKVLAKPYLVKPGEALKMVAMLDVPGVHEAVEQVVAAERAEAEQRAQQLRAQLAEVEAQLAELRDVG
jgi:hypothetical protein